MPVQEAMPKGFRQHSLMWTRLVDTRVSFARSRRACWSEYDERDK